MKETTREAAGVSIPVTALDTVVVGSGCAGFNAADWLFTLGRKNIAIITEGVRMGASRNTGSDKQTYYKLSLASDGEDSVRGLARTLFSGGGVHGDIALAEAAGSARSFFKLANLGVPFPTNEYGEYIGYKTDHDPRRRATSAGPLTSKYMTECLERACAEKGIRIFDGYTAVRLIAQDGEIGGVLCLNESRLRDASRGLHLFCARHVILATGGPAACYAASVYPESQTGMTGMALEAGASAANLNEWQYGLASVTFRWNVSGTYQQALPRYISVDAEGVEREFLLDGLESPEEAMRFAFLKGYQWPFDAAKVPGSSQIDMLVYHETQVLGRHVYMDFRRNPTGLSGNFSALSEEAHAYLESSGALLDTPIKRLAKMNPDAIALYKRHGIDLYAEPLEIAVCAQHHNGGIAVDRDWQTNIRGLFVVGEAAGTFGSVRPGGAALNATQVGSLRAAECIAWDTDEDESAPAWFGARAEDMAEQLLRGFGAALSAPPEAREVGECLGEAQRRMSECAAHIRDVPCMKALERELSETLTDFFGTVRARGADDLIRLMKARDAMITQRAVLSAVLLSAETQGSHGSALVRRSPPEPGYRSAVSRAENALVQTVYTAHEARSEMLPVREIPVPDDWFETAWAAYRRRKGKYAKRDVDRGGQNGERIP